MGTPSRNRHLPARWWLSAPLARGAAAGGTSPAVGLPDSSPSSSSQVLLVAPVECHEHVTHAVFERSGPEPPPENDNRLTVLTHPGKGILHAQQLAARVQWVEEGVPCCPMADILRVHDWPYIKKVRLRHQGALRDTTQRQQGVQQSSRRLTHGGRMRRRAAADVDEGALR